MNTKSQSDAINGKTMIWQSDAMEPVIDFGDEIRVTPTEGILEDGLYMMLLDNQNIQPPEARRLCAPAYRCIRYITRLAGGRLALAVANSSGYPELNEEVEEARYLSLWRVAGHVSVVKRNGRGFRAMSCRQPVAQAVVMRVEMGAGHE